VDIAVAAAAAAAAGRVVRMCT
jgi:hypothetical protein